MTFTEEHYRCVVDKYNLRDIFYSLGCTEILIEHIKVTHDIGANRFAIKHNTLYIFGENFTKEKANEIIEFIKESAVLFL